MKVGCNIVHIAHAQNLALAEGQLARRMADSHPSTNAMGQPLAL